MALVNVTNVVVLDNPTTFTNPLTFEVTFECLQELDADLEWKVIYVGSAEDERYDQVLEEVDVGPIPVGVNKFVLTADSPDPATIPTTDLVGVTVTLITCCYKGKEFIRVGYYVNNEHNDPAINAEIQEGRIPPAEMLDPASITRNILADKPRVTRFPIDWNASPGESGSAMAEAGPNENAMEEEEEEEVGQGDGDDMVADDADEEMAESGGNAEEEAGSESMVSEGEDDRSVDLEEASGDAMAECDGDVDADSSAAEDMEDLEEDAQGAGTGAGEGGKEATGEGEGAGKEGTREGAGEGAESRERAGEGTREGTGDGTGTSAVQTGASVDALSTATGVENVEVVVLTKSPLPVPTAQANCGAEGKQMTNADATGGTVLC